MDVIQPGIWNYMVCLRSKDRKATELPLWSVANDMCRSIFYQFDERIKHPIRSEYQFLFHLSFFKEKNFHKVLISEKNVVKYYINK